MGEKTLDRRIRKTKKAVQKALLDLLTEKKMADITVIELTDRADVNRKTFYNHYADIKAVLDELEDLLVDHLMKTLEELLIDGTNEGPMDVEKIEKHLKEIAYPYFRKLIHELEANPSFYTIFINCGDRARLREKIVHKEKDLFMRIYGDLNNRAIWLEYFLLFVVSGSMAVYEKWMQEDKRVSEENLARFFGLLFTTDNISEFL